MLDTNEEDSVLWCLAGCSHSREHACGGVSPPLHGDGPWRECVGGRTGRSGGTAPETPRCPGCDLKGDPQSPTLERWPPVQTFGVAVTRSLSPARGLASCGAHGVPAGVPALSRQVGSPPTRDTRQG